jgi:phosphoacetylglucosamine mutase
MITASHNPEADNGVKLVEPNGEMLVQDLEPIVTALAGAKDEDALLQQLAVLAEKLLLQSDGSNASAVASQQQQQQRAVVIIGRDTRSSGASLAAAAAAGIAAAGAHPLSAGLVTTPQLHSAVVSYNAYGSFDEQAYLTSLLESYRSLTHCVTGPVSAPLAVDCANGIGASKLAALECELAALGLQLQLINTGSGGSGGGLNERCGADFVQKAQAPPAGVLLQHLLRRLQ